MNMKIFKFIFLISLAAFPKIIESSSINETTFAFWDKADVQLFYIKPDKVDKNTQFLFVSHNKLTMEIAEQLIGVTMQEAGVSRIVEVDLQDLHTMELVE